MRRRPRGCSTRAPIRRLLRPRSRTSERAHELAAWSRAVRRHRKPLPPRADAAASGENRRHVIGSVTHLLRLHDAFRAEKCFISRCLRCWPMFPGLARTQALRQGFMTRIVFTTVVVALLSAAAVNTAAAQAAAECNRQYDACRSGCNA